MRVSQVRFRTLSHSTSRADEDGNVELSFVRKIDREKDVKTVSKNYFTLPTKVLFAAGVHQLSYKEHRSSLRVLFSIYFWFAYFFVVVLNTVTKAIALNHYTKLDDLTDNISFLLNHTMTAFKIAIFLYKQKDLIRLMKDVEGEKFRHQDCETFSANKLIRKAIRMSQAVYCTFSSFFIGMIIYSSWSAISERSGKSIFVNGTTDSEEILHKHKALPFHSWYPYSTQISPNFELTFIYQIFALFYTAQMAVALDTIAVAFMMHIKVQLEILSHNLRYIIPHAKKRQKNLYKSENGFIETIESLLDKNIEHHKAIIQLSEDFESVFSYQLLIQFVCSLLAICMLLWQVSSARFMSARFGSMVSYLGATSFELFIYCWFGNEMMLESLSVANAAWNSEWYKLLSKRYRHGVVMMIHRSQRVIVMTAGSFIDLTLDTFMTILQAAYSCFAVLKKMDNNITS